ncbi:hypothetical protein HDU97_006053 [Phlyctochytrium planicorne]|nr:hypothetical protein HDU97_006053 [Phlyctochytrium planicorne]
MRELFSKKKNSNTTALSSSSSSTSPASTTPLSSRSIFGLNLFQTLCSHNDTSHDVVVSPVSIWLALALAAVGSREGTMNSLCKTLGLQNRQSALSEEARRALESCEQLQQTYLRLTASNAVASVSSEPLSLDYLNTVREVFKSTVFEFKELINANPINSWVSSQTDGKIPALLEGEVNASILLLNAIYFKAKWKEPFAPFATCNATFYPLESPEIQCRMMALKKAFPYIETSDYQGVRLPYICDNTSSSSSAIVILPKTNCTFLSISKDVGQLNDTLNHLMDLELAPKLNTTVQLRLPKFNVDVTTNHLKDSLVDLGIASAFAPTDADFSGMLASGAKNLYVTDIVHRVFVQVDEVGTEAAAATAVMMMQYSRPEQLKVVEMVVNRPFFFLITNDTHKDILFFARLTSVPPSLQ